MYKFCHFQWKSRQKWRHRNKFELGKFVKFDKEALGTLKIFYGENDFVFIDVSVSLDVVDVVVAVTVVVGVVVVLADVVVVVVVGFGSYKIIFTIKKSTLSS